MAHEHIQAALMYEIVKMLEAIQRRGVGYINRTYKGGIDYCINNVVYKIAIEEMGADNDL